MSTSERRDGSLAVIAITLGEPAGIGPEVIIRALARRDVLPEAIWLLVGDRSVVEATEGLVGVRLNAEAVPDAGAARRGSPGLFLLDAATALPGRFAYGQVTPEGGRAAVAYIEMAVRQAQAGNVDSLVCGPVSKLAIRAAGLTFPGQTELIGYLCGEPDYTPVLFGTRTRAFLHTVHVPLRKAVENVTRTSVLRTISRAATALRDAFGCVAPRLGVAGLNPHAGDGGVLGSEEHEEIEPAIGDARSQGIDVSGPFPADSLLAGKGSGVFDGVVCMYHDQAAIALKPDGYLYFTYGFPFPRWTVGHGTAYDIAGRGVADPALMIRALRTAAEMVQWSGRKTHDRRS